MKMTVFGAKGTILSTDQFISHLNKVSKQYQIELQIIDAAFIFEKEHLHSAFIHAQRAFDQKRNTCNTIAMETILYASGERQIQRALQKIGIKPSTTDHALVIIHSKRVDLDRIKNKIVKDTNLIFTDKVFKGTCETMKRWGFSNAELNTVPEYKYGDLILEKVALVDVIKK